MDAEHHLAALIPFRLDSLAIFDDVLNRRLLWGNDRQMQILVDGVLAFYGTTLFFTNPIFEMASLHIRALLNFMGLTARNGRLSGVTRRAGDSAIELVLSSTGALSMVSREDVLVTFPENPAETEAMLVAALRAANKGMAHLTIDYQSDRVFVEHLGAASVITQRLVETFVYERLGRSRPRTPLSRDLA